VVDPYRVLGVDPGTDREVARTAWIELVKALHPDRRGSDDPEVRAEAARRLAEINAAYHDLSVSWDARPSSAPEVDRPATDNLAVVAFRTVTFEFLLVAAGDLGDVTDTDEPFSMTIHVDGPPTGFCRIELFPEAGGTVVSAASEQVDAAHVCRVLAVALNALGLDAVVAR
jgi:DnaJ domain